MEVDNILILNIHGYFNANPFSAANFDFYSSFSPFNMNMKL